MKKVEAGKKVHLYIHANDADRLRIVVFSRLWYIFVYTVSLQIKSQAQNRTWRKKILQVAGK